MWTAPLSDSSDDNHPMALRCRERAPSTTSNSEVKGTAKWASLKLTSGCTQTLRAGLSGFHRADHIPRINYYLAGCAFVAAEVIACVPRSSPVAPALGYRECE